MEDLPIFKISKESVQDCSEVGPSIECLNS